jgi:hypothetical protein
MLRLVVRCPAAPVALLTDIKVDERVLDMVRGTLVSVYCRACDANHTVTVRECRAYRLNGHVRPGARVRAS